jgi:p-cumate 2,3-dioxygenase alpha subunit
VTRSASPDRFIVEDAERGLFRVHRKTFTDPAVLADEKARVFDRSWLYVGHESELRAHGDFRARKVGGRPVIFARGDDGAVRVLLNTCRHRGAQVCRERAGNARTFQCIYHGWTYDNRGGLCGIPGEDAYGPRFDRGELGLRCAPRTERYRGFVFVSFDPSIIPLETYLAGAREYLDVAYDAAEGALEVADGAHEYSVRANWKLLVENSMDGYHAMTTHHRYFKGFLVDVGAAGPEARRPAIGPGRALGNGHASMLLYRQSDELTDSALTSLGQTAQAEVEALHARLLARLGSERARRAMHGVGNLFVFPNFIYIDAWKVARTFYPVSPDFVEVSAWGLMPAGDSRELRHKRIQNLLAFLGPGGWATPDDNEALESCQRGFANTDVEWSDISRGMLREESALATDELQMRTFWRRWHDLITDASPRGREASSGARVEEGSARRWTVS